MNSRDLAKKCRQLILRCAPETPLTQIRKIDDLHFEVQSSNSSNLYQINLVTTTCSCSDFPRIRLCKHIAAMMHFFGGVDLRPQPLINAGAFSSPVQRDSSITHMDNSAAIPSIINDIFSLSQELVTKGPSDPGIANSLNSLQAIRSGLRGILLAGNGSHLPEKENIGPNQCSWPETAARIGMKHVNKCPNGKVNSVLMAQHIGKPNRKRTTNDDPYGAGEQSGKQAKPDAHSAATNVRARAAEERAEPLPVSQPVGIKPHKLM